MTVMPKGRKTPPLSDGNCVLGSVLEVNFSSESF